MSAVEHGVGLLAGDPLWLFVTRLALLGLAAVLINRIWGRILRLGGALQVDWVRKLPVHHWPCGHRSRLVTKSRSDSIAGWLNTRVSPAYIYGLVMVLTSRCLAIF